MGALIVCPPQQKFQAIPDIEKYHPELNLLTKMNTLVVQEYEIVSLGRILYNDEGPKGNSGESPSEEKPIYHDNHGHKIGKWYFCSMVPKKKIELEEGDFYLTPEGYKCFTAQYHLKRGYCCQSGCRHCPYGFDKKTGNLKN